MIALSAAQAEHAAALHDRALIVLAHDHLSTPTDLLAMRQGGVTAKTVHVIVDTLIWEDGGVHYEESIHSCDGWARRALLAIERLLRQVDAAPERLMVVRAAQDVIQAKREGKQGLLIGFEGAKPLEGTIESLGAFYRLGLRHLQLTWAYKNQLVDWREDGRDCGLTEFGRQVIHEANRLGILIDPSHMRERSWHEAVRQSDGPVLAGHSTASGLHPGHGDLSDDQLKLLAEKGSVIGLHFCSHYLKDVGRRSDGRWWEVRADIDDLIAHIDYISRLIGMDYIALGPDYFQNDEAYATAMGYNVNHIKDLDDISEMPNLTRALVARGFSDTDIEKLLGGNMLRLYREVLGA
jgi:membrane dipeptidase